MKSEVILSIATKYNKLAHQIALRWGIDKGFALIPKSAIRDHTHSNIQIGDFKLTQEEVE